MRQSALSTLAVLATAFMLLITPAAAAQGDSWLDGDLASWNSPGMDIPTPPTIDGNPSPLCAEQARPAETAEDEALAAKGWRLFLPYQRGWGETLISGFAAYDGMCRPLGYQSFVFVDGVFAGTIAPEPMDSRTEGGAREVTLWLEDQLSAEFDRYASEDPACCPSSTTPINYTIEQTADGPVLNPVRP